MKKHLALIAMAGVTAAFSITASRADEYVFASFSCGPSYPHLCKDPKERARYELENKRNAERAAADAKARSDALKAEQAKHERDRKAVMDQFHLGPGREAEAERFMKMRQAALQAAPKPAAPDKPRDCKVTKRTALPMGIADTRAEAEAQARSRATNACGAGGVADYGLAGACNEQIGIKRNHYWVCTPRVQCNATEERCASSPSPGSAQ